MTSDDWWRNFFGNKTHKLIWFNLSINEVDLISNSVYKQLREGKYKVVLIFTERTGKNTYSLIAIVSRMKLNRKEVIKSIEEIPFYDVNKNNWRNGA